MPDDAPPGPSTQASAPQAPGRLAREDATNFGTRTLEVRPETRARDLGVSRSGFGGRPVLVGGDPERPGDRFAWAAHVRRHPQHVFWGRLAGSRCGIGHLHTDQRLVVWQVQAPEHTNLVLCDALPSRVAKEGPIAHAFDHYPAHLDLLHGQDFTSREAARLLDHVARHEHAVPGPDRPAIRVLDGRADLVVQAALVVQQQPRRPVAEHDATAMGPPASGATGDLHKAAEAIGGVEPADAPEEVRYRQPVCGGPAML